ncbi:methyltransferase domain-containing protein [Ruegeria sp. 2205SS24-7]|uniref:class I SAM-dependent methyltransferase n=1 Tax=Ruegeria discodermiae TaxID=3064389 RepID=UPI00274172EF|nr:class I SAM-dependent methyltransferase [Ruegeria sp. 2205SS24-7]MDP5217615.1 methyltransferase domain-containing protein [Ruegeria sp. 2205SS24-7]
MKDAPAGSSRDTRKLAKLYSEVSHWQRDRGTCLIETAAPKDGEHVLDLGCGTGELTAELARRIGASGQLTAIDPDPQRLAQARAQFGASFPTIRFVQTKAEDLSMVSDGSIDLIYSNYTLHWVLDQNRLFSEIERVLRPGGRMVTEFLGAPIETLIELLLMMPEGAKALGENVYLDEVGWRALIAPHALAIEKLDWPETPLRYENLQALFDWLEATSHGAFDHRKLSAQDRAMLTRRFPAEIELACLGLRMVLRKTG